MLRFTTAGESHGSAVIAVLEGLPSGLRLDTAFINAELARRQQGYGRGGRMQIERDSMEVLSGLRDGVTLGSPLAMVIRNRDATLVSLGPVHEPRPGHADFAGCLKHGTSDARDILERASARETAARVMAGAACACLLREFGIHLFGHVVSLGGVQAQCPALHLHPGVSELDAGWVGPLRRSRDASPFHTLDPDAEAAMRGAVDAARRAGDTLGGMVEVVAYGVPPGIGNGTQWDRKLDGQIAQACMAVQAIKSVEIGVGRDAADQPGSRTHDPIVRGESGNPNWPGGLTRPTNHAGGIEGGMSNGMPVVARAAMKPIATLMRPLPTVNLATGAVADAAKERSDICAVPAASVVLEHAVAVPLAAAFLGKFGGDSMAELRRNFSGYLDQLRRTLPEAGA